jgi:hypothetical protein
MKNITFLVLFCLTVGLLNAQTAKTGWDYPVKPGTTAWEALFTHDEMLEACRIPDEVLKSVTTEELVEICLNYPLKLDFYVYNSLQDGLKNVSTQFNGLQELFSRKDNAQYLLGLLKDNDLEAMPAKILSTTELGKLISRQTLAELFLSHQSVLANANPEQQKEIARVAMKNMTLKERLPESASWFHLEVSAYLLCSSLKKSDTGIALSPNLEQLFNEGILPDSGTIIEELKQHFYQSLTINEVRR